MLASLLRLVRARVGCRPGILAASLALGLTSCAPRSSPRQAAESWRPRYVVLLSIDTCRADHVGCYGYSRRTTPHLDRLAREGVRFEQAYSQSNESLYSYASVFSGLYPEAQGALAPATYRLVPGRGTLASVLRARGLATGGFVGGAHLSASLGFAEGFDTYQDSPDFGSFFHSMPRALGWLEQKAAARQPAFLFVQGYDAHVPYHKPLGFDRLYRTQPPPESLRPLLTGSEEADLVFAGRQYSPEEVSQRVWASHRQPGESLDPAAWLPRLVAGGLQGRAISADERAQLVASYDGALSYADTWVGLLRARIEQLGIAEQALVVVMGDHGEDLLDHGFLAHRTSMHDSTLHVPLVAWAPALGQGGRSVQRLVELRSLRSTLCDLVDGRASAPAPHAAGSLRSWIVGAAEGASTSGGVREGGSARQALDQDEAVLAQGVRPAATLRTSRYRLVLRAPEGPAPAERVAGSVAGPASAREAPSTSTDDAELYDLQVDPTEQRNLLAPSAGRSPEVVLLAARLRERLQRAIKAGI